MVVDRNADTATVTAEAIVEDGGKAVAVTCDIGSPDDLVALGAAVEQRYGRLDVLANRPRSATTARSRRPTPWHGTTSSR